MSESVELLQTLIRNACINDGTDSANEEANADDICGILQGCGADIEVFDAAPGRRSVISRLPGTNPGAPTLMLIGHTDVVPAHSARWKHDPFGGELIDGFVWGRGAMDMLGHVATMATALRDYARTGKHYGGDIVFAAVADEEALSTKGTGWLMEHQPDAMSADWIVTESGGSSVGPIDAPLITSLTAEKGAWRIRITIRRDPVHSSMAYGSTLSTQVAAEVITRINEYTHPVLITETWRQIMGVGWDGPGENPVLNPDLINAILPHVPALAAKNCYALSRMSTVVTGIETDGSWNTVPAEIRIEVDVRTLIGQTLDDVYEHLRLALGELAETVEISVVAGSDGSSSPIGTPLWQLMSDAARVQVPGAELRPIMASGVTDARFYRHPGATAYGFGLYSARLPVEEIPTMLHGDDERVDVESIHMMGELWSTMFGHSAERTAR